jgi:uncharacterized membrane protein (UPF0127 family)
MLQVTVEDTRNGAGERLIADQVIYADTPALRRKGLLGRESLDPGQGVLLVMPRRLRLSLLHTIHMFGVPFELAAAWLDEEGFILEARLARPGRMYVPPGILTGNRFILELHPEYLPQLRSGHRVRWREADYG